MKSLKCDMCEFVMQAETFDEWTKAMRGHYATTHGEWMKEMMNKPHSEEEREKWMAEAKAKFEAA